MSDDTIIVPAKLNRDEAIAAITAAATQLEKACLHQLGIPLSGLTGPIQLGGPGAGATIPVAALLALIEGR